MKMDIYSELLDGIYAGFPILFVGSGFSALAKNKNGNPMKTGGQFSKLLHDKLGFTKEYPLDIVSREFKEKFGEHELFTLLSNEFTVESPSAEQFSTLKIPWKRIYTTNYDDVLEECLDRNGSKFKTLNSVLNQPKDVDKKTTSIIHLNGKIKNVEFKYFDESIRLTRASYLTTNFIETSWFSLFKADLTVATAIIIIGFSTYDIDIARILYEDPLLRQKTFFLEVVDLDPVVEKELGQFGSVIKNPLLRFTQALESYIPIIKEHQKLISLTQNALPDDPREANGDDVFSLLLYGDFIPEVELGTSQNSKLYTVDNNLVEDAITRIERGERYFLIHSDLGNGKSIFTEKLKISLLSRKFSCFHLSEYEDYIENDLLSIATYDRPVIFIDDFFRNSRSIAKIISMVPHAAIVSSTRSAIYELRSYRVEEVYRTNYIEYDLNKLDERGILGFAKLIDENGLWSDFSRRSDADKIDFIRNKCQSEIRNILISLFQSPSIKKKIVEAFEVKPDLDALKVLSTALLLDVAGFYPDISLVSQLSGVDVYKNREKINNAFSREFIHNVRGSIRVKSSIFGEYILQNVMNVEYMVDELIRITNKCEKYKMTTEVFADIQKEIIRFSFIDRVFKRKNAGDSYKRLYDSIKDLPSMARNPQFWLQYAIARLEDGNYAISEIHFRTAYSHAGKQSGYDTFQIDNHYARYLLESRTKDPSYRDDFKAFIDAHTLLIKQARKEKDAYYPYKVARSYFQFYRARGENYSKDQLRVLRNCCNEMIKEIRNVPRSAKKYYTIDECYVDLNAMLGELNIRLGK